MKKIVFSCYRNEADIKDEWEGVCVNVRCFDHVLTLGKVYQLKSLSEPCENVVLVVCDDNDERGLDRTRFSREDAHG